MEQAKKDKISLAIFMGLLLMPPELHRRHLEAVLNTEPSDSAAALMVEHGVTADDMREVAREYLKVITDTDSEIVRH